MQTTRNPKVLNNVLKYKLRPILDKISQLEIIQSDNTEYIKSIEAQVDSMKESANVELNEYNTATSKLDSELEQSNKTLSNLIKNTLYNPNSTTTSTGSGGEITETTETKLISDKTLDAACYGLVLDNIDYAIFGISGKGITITKDDIDNRTKEYDWMNPANSENTFPSYYVNDILLIDTDTALMSTNNGIIIYTLSTNKYLQIDKTYGLPHNKVYRTIKVRTNDEKTNGYLAMTEKGVAYSSDMKRWSIVDKNFTESCNCVSKTNLINAGQSLVFIGTSSGVYYLDIDKFIYDDLRTIKEIPGLNLTIPAVYINGIAYDTENDILAIVSLSGLSVISNVKELIASGKTLTSSLKDSLDNFYYKVYNTNSGLNTTSCYDCIYSVDNKLIICTSNGLNITDDYDKFTSITSVVNSYNPNSEELLNSYICNKIIRKNDNTYTILHGVGLTENIHI